jgi:hypothetical protein
MRLHSGDLLTVWPILEVAAARASLAQLFVVQSNQFLIVRDPALAAIPQALYSKVVHLKIPCWHLPFASLDF